MQIQLFVIFCFAFATTKKFYPKITSNAKRLFCDNWTRGQLPILAHRLIPSSKVIFRGLISPNMPPWEKITIVLPYFSPDKKENNPKKIFSSYNCVKNANLLTIFQNIFPAARQIWPPSIFELMQKIVYSIDLKFSDLS